MSSRTIRTSEYYREGSGWRDTQGRFVASSYVYGNAAPDLFGEEEEERERLARREARRRERERRAREELRHEEALQRRRELRHAQARVRFSVAITMLMMTVLTAAIIGYVRLLSSVTVSSRKISTLETQIEKQRTLNDQRLEEIDASINMDEIRSIAINELGMKYADEDQIKTYSSQADDYVHQVAEVGN